MTNYEVERLKNLILSMYVDVYDDNDRYYNKALYDVIGKIVDTFWDDKDNAPTVEFPEQITIKCDTEEEKQRLLSALRNARVTICKEAENEDRKS